MSDPIDPTARRRLEAAVRLARNQLDAADMLARFPHRPESMVLLARAARTIEGALRDLASGRPEPADLDPAAIDGSLAGALGAARERLEAAPAVDAELSEDDLRHWRDARKLAGEILYGLRVAARRRRPPLPRRTVLSLGGLGALALAGAAIVVARCPRDRLEIGASDFYGSGQPDSAYPPNNALDGNRTTEWLTPEGQGGWLELRFARPIRVTEVRVTNAHNPPFNDRAAKDLGVELYHGERLLRRIQVAFDRIEPNPQPRAVPIAAAGVTRIRFIVASWHGRGGGIAEIEVIESESVR